MPLEENSRDHSKEQKIRVNKEEAEVVDHKEITITRREVKVNKEEEEVENHKDKTTRKEDKVNKERKITHLDMWMNTPFMSETLVSRQQK